MPGIADRELVNNIVKLYLHAQALGDYAQLHSYIAIADDTQAFAAYLK